MKFQGEIRKFTLFYLRSSLERSFKISTNGNSCAYISDSFFIQENEDFPGLINKMFFFY